MAKIILASTSAARQNILQQAGIDFEVMAPQVDEQKIKNEFSGTPDQLAQHLAVAKAQNIAQDVYVIGGDQVLVCKNRVFDKPRTKEVLKENLFYLQGQTHRLVSGVAVARAGKMLWQDVDVAYVRLRSMDEQAIDAYIDRAGETCLSCVGGYQLEGLGAQIIEQVKGDYFTVLGLPLFQLISFFQREDLL